MKDRKYSKTNPNYEKWEEDKLVLSWMERLSRPTDDDSDGNSNHSNNNSTNNGKPKKKNLPKYIDSMVLEWLNYTKQSSWTTTATTTTGSHTSYHPNNENENNNINKQGCERHSFPQINFLLQQQQQPQQEPMVIRPKIIDQIVLVADLSELTDVWTKVLKYTYNTQKKKRKQSKVTTRNSTGVYFKETFFPTRRLDLFSNSTIQQLCRYVQLDYMFLDYEPPEQCQRMFAF